MKLVASTSSWSNLHQSLSQLSKTNFKYLEFGEKQFFSMNPLDAKMIKVSARNAGLTPLSVYFDAHLYVKPRQYSLEKDIKKTYEENFKPLNIQMAILGEAIRPKRPEKEENKEGNLPAEEKKEEKEILVKDIAETFNMLYDEAKKYDLKLFFRPKKDGVINSEEKIKEFLLLSEAGLCADMDELEEMNIDFEKFFAENKQRILFINLNPENEEKFKKNLDVIKEKEYEGFVVVCAGKDKILESSGWF